MMRREAPSAQPHLAVIRNGQRMVKKRTPDIKAGASVSLTDNLISKVAKKRPVIDHRSDGQVAIIREWVIEIHLASRVTVPPNVTAIRIVTIPGNRGVIRGVIKP